MKKGSRLSACLIQVRISTFTDVDKQERVNQHRRDFEEISFKNLKIFWNYLSANCFHVLLLIDGQKNMIVWESKRSRSIKNKPKFCNMKYCNFPAKIFEKNFFVTKDSLVRKFQKSIFFLVDTLLLIHVHRN